MADRRNARLSGHGLLSEGKPYERSDEMPWVRVSFGAHPGSHIGVALCECGEQSPELTSDGARKRWHREVHKPEVRRQQEAGDE